MQHKLDQITKLAKGSKLQRLLHQPIKYIKGITYRQLIYPLTKKGKLLTTTTFFNQEMKVLLPAGMDIYLLGAKTHDSEIRLSRFLLKTLQKGDTFVDIGAHFGYYSLLAADIVGSEGNVLAVEASPSTFELLKKNVVANPIVNAHHLAATAQKAKLSFYEFPILYSEYNTSNPSIYEGESWYQQHPPQKVEVQGICVDDLIADIMDKVAVVKIDVEGGEPEVIKGMVNFLKTGKGKIIMEYLPQNAANQGQTTAQNAADLLKKANYQAHAIQKDGTLLMVEDIETYLLKERLDSDNLVFFRP